MDGPVQFAWRRHDDMKESDRIFPPTVRLDQTCLRCVGLARNDEVVKQNRTGLSARTPMYGRRVPHAVNED